MTAFLCLLLGFLAPSTPFLNHEMDYKHLEAVIASRYPDATSVELIPHEDFAQVCFVQGNRPQTAIFNLDGNWLGTCERIPARNVPMGVLRESRHDLKGTPTYYFRLSSPHTYAPVYVSYLRVSERFPFRFPDNGIMAVQVMQESGYQDFILDRDGIHPAFRNSGVWIGGAYHASGRPLTHQTLKGLMEDFLVPGLPGRMVLPAAERSRAGMYRGYSVCQ